MMSAKFSARSSTVRLNACISFSKIDFLAIRHCEASRFEHLEIKMRDG